MANYAVGCPVVLIWRNPLLLATSVAPLAMHLLHSCSKTAASRLVVAIGVLMAAGFALASRGLRGWNGGRDVGSFLAIFGLLFGLYLLAGTWSRRLPTGNRWVLGGIFAAAALFRLLLLPAGLLPDDRRAATLTDLSSQGIGYQRFLLYDQDIWRYLWDGHLLSSGVDPYRHTPEEWEDLSFTNDTAAAELFVDPPWSEIFENLAYRENLTVYPPLAQAFFAACHRLAPGSVLLFKSALVVLDLIACWLLYLLLLRLGRRPEEVIFYAWNPLLIKELAGSGHVDALVIPLLLAAVLAMHGGRRKLALAVFGLSVLAKLTPIVLAGLFLRRCRPRQWPVLALTVALGYLPFIASWRQILQALSDFGAGWTFNPGIWLLAQNIFERWLPGRGAGWASALWLVSTLLILLWLLRRRVAEDRWPRQIYLLLAAFLLLGPTVMPWYLLWALPFAVASGARAWPLATGLALLSYLIYIDGVERAWWLILEHGLIWGLIGWDAWRWRQAELALPDPWE